MLTLPQKIKQDLSGNITNIDYLVAIKTSPTIFISTTPQMFGPFESVSDYGGNISDDPTLSFEGVWGGTSDTTLIIEDDGTGDNNVAKWLGNGYAHLTQDILEIGSYYRITLDCPYNDQTKIGINQNEGDSIKTYNIVPINQTGTFTKEFKADNSTLLRLYANDTMNPDGSSAYSQEVHIDNIYVEKLGIQPIYYEDAGIKISNIKEKIDLKTKKIQLSSVSMTMSNIVQNNQQVLSDVIGSGLGKDISIYLKTQSAEGLEDCVSVAQLKITRYSHDEKTIKINADDMHLESFFKTIPSEKYLLKKDKNTFEKYHLKTVPMLYGHLENAPAVPYFEEGSELSKDGVQIIPDTSFFASSDRVIEGIKRWINPTTSYDELIDNNILKIRLSDTTLASVPCKPYVNISDDVRNYHNYNQWNRYKDYITIHLPEITDVFDSSRAGLWCSHISKLINKSPSEVYSVCHNNSYEPAGNFIRHEFMDDDNPNYIGRVCSGYFSTGTLGTSDIGVQSFEFDDLIGIDIYKVEKAGEEFSFPVDAHFLGNGYIHFEPNNLPSGAESNLFPQILIGATYAPRKHDDEIDTAGERLVELASPSQWNWSHGLLSNYNKLRDNRGVNIFEFDGDTDWRQSYFLSRFHEGDPSNSGTFKSEYQDPLFYPIINSNTVVLYYLPFWNVDNYEFDYSFPYPEFGPTHTISIEAEWDNMVLRKYWRNKDVFEKDFFVNAKGKASGTIDQIMLYDQPMVGNQGGWTEGDVTKVASVKANFYVFYKEETPSDTITSNGTEHDHMVYLNELISKSEHKTKQYGGYVYQLMFWGETEGRSHYLYDIELNNIESSEELIFQEEGEVDVDGSTIEFTNPPTPPTHYFGGDGWGNLTHTTGWKVGVSANNYLGGEQQLLQWEVGGGGQSWGGINREYIDGGKFIYAKFEYNSDGAISGITHLQESAWGDIVNKFNSSNIPSSLNTGYTIPIWGRQLDEYYKDAKKLIEAPHEIIQDIVTNELGAGSVEIKDFDRESKFAFSINKPTSSKDIIEDISRQSNSIFRYRISDGVGVLNYIKDMYTPEDVNKTITTSKILKYSFDKTKIEDLGFGGTIVKWGWDYGKEDFLDTTGKVVANNLPEYLDYYGVSDSDKYQQEIEAPYISNEATAYKFRNFIHSQNRNTHLIINFTVSINEGIELEVGDIVAFDDDINGLKPYGKSITSDYILITQQVFPYFIITSISKNINKVDIQVMQLHNLTGTPIVFGCTDSNATDATYNPNATVDDGSCEYLGPDDELVYGCTNPNAINYDPTANADDGSCIIPPNPEIPVAHLNITVADADGQEVIYDEPIFYGGIGHVVTVNTSGSYDNDGEIVAWEWEGFTDWMMEALGIGNPNSLDNNILEGGFSLEIPALYIEYFHVGYRVTDNDGNISEWVHFEAQIDPEPYTMLGDINQDGYPDILDLVVMVGYIIGYSELTDDEIYVADMNQDGSIDIFDAIELVNIVLGG